MNLGTVGISSTGVQMCVGGIFDISSIIDPGSKGPAWIVGDTFLKNVYSVYRANPPSVGFATLASEFNKSPTGVCQNTMVLRGARY